MRSLKLGNVLVFVQRIFRPRWSTNQLYNKPNLRLLTTSTSEMDLDGEVPDLLSQFDALDSANGYRLYSGGGRGQNQGLA